MTERCKIVFKEEGVKPAFDKSIVMPAEIGRVLAFINDYVGENYTHHRWLSHSR